MFQQKVFSISLWVKTGEQTTSAYAFSSGEHQTNPSQSYGWVIKPSENCYGENYLKEVTFAMDDGVSFNHTCGNSLISDNTWHFIVITYDGTNVRIYVDNKLEKTNLVGSPIFTNPNHVAIGNWYYGGAWSYALHGTVDEVGYWQKVLNTNEINELWNNGNGEAFMLTT